MANGEHLELAKCYVTIVPSLEGSQGTITKELTGATVEAGDKAGKESGTKFGESFSASLKKAAVAIGATMAGLGAAAVATGKSFIKAANDVSSMGDSIGDNAAKMGISTKAYQEWDFVLKRAGSSIDAMKTSMKTLQNAAASNNAAFKDLGITQKELQTLSPEELFNRTVTALQGVENTTQRTALASKLLGKGAMELGGVFNMTAKETEEAKQKMYDLGAYMDEDAIAASDKYQDTLADLKDSIGGLKTRVMTDFLPGITSVMSGLSKVFAGNGGIEEIQNGLKSIITKITTMAPQFISVAQTIITSLITGFGPMIPQLTSAIFSIIITAITTITSMIPQMMPSIISGIQGIIQATIAALPVIIQGLMQLITALAQWLSSDGVIQNLVNGIVQMATELVKSFAKILPILLPAIVTIIAEIAKVLTEEENLKLILQAIWEIIKAIGIAIVKCVPILLEAVGTIIGNLFTAAVDGVAAIFEKLVPMVSDFIEFWVNKFKEGWTRFTDWIANCGKAIVNFFTGIKNKVVEFFTNIKNAISGFLDNIKKFFSDGFNAIKNGASELFNRIKNTVTDAINTLKELPGKAVQMGKDMIQGLINGIKNMASKAVDAVKNVGKNLINGIKNVLKIGSPSKVFEQLGEFTAEGFAIGYEDTMDDFKADMAMDMNGLTASMTADISAHSPDTYEGSGDTYNGAPITINVYGAEGQNINDLAQEIAYKLESMTKRKGAVYA